MPHYYLKENEEVVEEKPVWRWTQV